MVVIDHAIPFLPLWLAPSHNITVVSAEEITNHLLRSTGATALFVRSVTTVNEQLLRGTNIAFVGSATAGIDHVDVDYLQSNTIAFAFAPGCNANAVANYVLDAIERNTITSNAAIGVVGFGHVGSCVARYARMRGNTVYVCDPPLVEQQFTFPSWSTVVDLATLLRCCDVVSVHVPLTRHGVYATANMITEDLLQSTKPGALFINTARGGIVLERALANLEQAGHLRAVLDVFAGEPDNVDPYVLQRVSQCTPHIAGYSFEAKQKGAQMVYEAFTGYVPPQPQLTSANFRLMRELYPLPHESRTPPTWEQCNVGDS